MNIVWHGNAKMPKVNKFTSDQVLFTVDDDPIIYFGHYHSNGFFYNDRRNVNNDLFFAVGNVFAAKNSLGDITGIKHVVSWAYLNEPIQKS